MTGKGHNLAGIALMPAIYFQTFTTFNSHVVSAVACLFLISGATAPDWLEVRRSNGGTLIKHRTVTHWVALWLLALFFSNYMMTHIDVYIFGNTIIFNKYITASLLGFSIGGLLHLAVDFPNPMGVPVLTPFHRLSLNLWKSGKKEAMIISIIVLFSFFYIGISSGVIVVDLPKIIFYLKSMKG